LTEDSGVAVSLEGGAPNTIVTSLVSPTSIAVDDSRLYVGVGYVEPTAAASILRIGGSGTVVLAQGIGVFAVNCAARCGRVTCARDGATVCALSNGRRGPLAGRDNDGIARPSSFR
jgi:hypothetical protein